ncbi:MAG: SDR family oxidoreductase [Proteobacteria bacterium]|nr:MAG: SDR family oxidoreductase [Pseudomonadota bacterium]
MNIQYQFQGKAALVTGGAAGIGLEISKAFLSAGASVAIWDYSETALAAAERELAPFSGRVHFAKVDVSRPSECSEAAAKLPFALDVLINNAGITRDKSFKKMGAEDWDAVISTNLSGLFHVTKSVFEKFHGGPAGKRIINISSIVGLFGNFGQSNYAAAKAGVIGLTKTWAREFAKSGFTVNAIAPGFIATAMTESMPAEVLAGMRAKVPLQSLGKPKDIANACLFLSSEEAAYISGTVLSVDGALTL